MLKEQQRSSEWNHSLSKIMQIQFVFDVNVRPWKNGMSIFTKNKWFLPDSPSRKECAQKWNTCLFKTLHLFTKFL